MSVSKIQEMNQYIHDLANASGIHDVYKEHRFKTSDHLKKLLEESKNGQDKKTLTKQYETALVINEYGRKLLKAVEDELELQVKRRNDLKSVIDQMVKEYPDLVDEKK